MLSVDGDADTIQQYNTKQIYNVPISPNNKKRNQRRDAPVEASVCKGWYKFRQHAPLLSNNDVSLLMREKLYRCSLQSCMLYGGET